MRKLLFVLGALGCSVLAMGCDDELCVVGFCDSQIECEDECLTVCEGELLAYECNVFEECECDCAIGCFL